MRRVGRKGRMQNSFKYLKYWIKDWEFLNLSRIKLMCPRLHIIWNSSFSKPPFFSGPATFRSRFKSPPHNRLLWSGPHAYQSVSNKSTMTQVLARKSLGSPVNAVQGAAVVSVHISVNVAWLIIWYNLYFWKKCASVILCQLWTS